MLQSDGQGPGERGLLRGKGGSVAGISDDSVSSLGAKEGYETVTAWAVCCSYGPGAASTHTRRTGCLRENLTRVAFASQARRHKTRHQGVFFLDDDAARYELVKVCFPVEASMDVVKVIAKVGLASQARAWYDRVSTESDAGDTASGSNPESALRSSPGANSPSSKPCGIHEAPGRVVCAVVRYVYVLGRKSFGGLSFKASRLREVVQDINL